MLNKIKRVVILGSRSRGLIKKEKAIPFFRPVLQRWHAWKAGFLSESPYFYDWNNFSPADYISDLERFSLTPDINSNLALVLDDKDIFRRLIDPLLPTPKKLGQLNKGHISQGPYPNIDALLEGESNFVTKPVRGGGGSSIGLFELNNHVWHINGDASSVPVVRETLTKLQSSIVQRQVRNAAYAQNIFPHSLNTIRILTMWDASRAEPFIAVAVHRFGSSTTRPVDNWTQGGISVALDLDTGVLGQGATYPKDGQLRWYSAHPETNVHFEGLEVPGWTNIVDSILRAASALSFVPYIGWDIAAQDVGFVVIEANSNTDVNLLQIHGPLLRDPRVREFYQTHGALMQWRQK